LNYQIYFEATL